MNKKINNFLKTKSNYTKIMFHITDAKSAKKILKYNFDISKSKSHCFGKGANMSDNIEHLKHYYTAKNKNTIIISLVKYNNQKLNDLTAKTNKDVEKQINKYGYTLPTFMKPPKGYDILYNDDVFVFPKPKKQICPLFTINAKKLFIN
jgi:hypothetical protein